MPTYVIHVTYIIIYIYQFWIHDTYLTLWKIMRTPCVNAQLFETFDPTVFTISPSAYIAIAKRGNQPLTKGAKSIFFLETSIWFSIGFCRQLLSDFWVYFK